MFIISKTRTGKTELSYFFVICFLSLQIFCTIYCRTNLHEGVIRDVERQRRRQAENLYRLQQQIDFSKDMKKKQLEANPENVDP